MGWSVDEVELFLERLQLAQYRPLARQHLVDGELLGELVRLGGLEELGFVCKSHEAMVVEELRTLSHEDVLDNDLKNSSVKSSSSSSSSSRHSSSSSSDDSSSDERGSSVQASPTGISHKRDSAGLRKKTKLKAGKGSGKGKKPKLVPPKVKAVVDINIPRCMQCKNAMLWSDYSLGAYKFGWDCTNVDTCESKSATVGAFRWFCRKCKNDVCERCGAAQVANAIAAQTSANQITVDQANEAGEREPDAKMAEREPDAEATSANQITVDQEPQEKRQNTEQE